MEAMACARKQWSVHTSSVRKQTKEKAHVKYSKGGWGCVCGWADPEMPLGSQTEGQAQLQVSMRACTSVCVRVRM